MVYEVKLLPVVFADLRDVKKSYGEISAELALDFKSEFEKEIYYIKSYPKHYQLKYNGLRQSLVSRFPYAIFYMLDEVQMKVVVIGVLHTRRDPDLIKKRFK